MIRVFFFNRKESVIHPGRELISFSPKAVPPSANFGCHGSGACTGFHTCTRAAYSWFSRTQGNSPRELPSDMDTSAETVRYP
ncbi:MAG: hypothetical protein ACLR0U_16340 [Enterocloster clostridioformis]